MWVNVIQGSSFCLCDRLIVLVRIKAASDSPNLGFEVTAVVQVYTIKQLLCRGKIAVIRLVFSEIP